jgi:hypothetical protein
VYGIGVWLAARRLNASKFGNSPPSTVLDGGDERQAETSTKCWSSAKEIRHARPSQ